MLQAQHARNFMSRTRLYKRKHSTISEFEKRRRPERTAGLYQSGLSPYQRGVYTHWLPSARGNTQVVEDPTRTMVRMST
ncbi:hypothetical protein SRABI112_01736 [Pseudomonas mediterranea]|nr:hypothetical protein SRABI112_01736 [Pseudomonas mediterranea]